MRHERRSRIRGVSSLTGNYMSKLPSVLYLGDSENIADRNNVIDKGTRVIFICLSPLISYAETRKLLDNSLLIIARNVFHKRCQFPSDITDDGNSVQMSLSFSQIELARTIFAVTSWIIYHVDISVQPAQACLCILTRTKSTSSSPFSDISNPHIAPDKPKSSFVCSR